MALPVNGVEVTAIVVLEPAGFEGSISTAAVALFVRRCGRRSMAGG